MSCAFSCRRAFRNAFLSAFRKAFATPPGYSAALAGSGSSEVQWGQRVAPSASSCLQ